MAFVNAELHIVVEDFLGFQSFVFWPQLPPACKQVGSNSADIETMNLAHIWSGLRFGVRTSWHSSQLPQEIPRPAKKAHKLP